MMLDIDNLDSLKCYLTQRECTSAEEIISLKALVGGVSSRTVRVTWRNGRGWVIKQSLSKLNVDVDWFSNPGRISVEAKALRWFGRITPPGTTPLFVFEDAAHYLLGMEAVPEVYENWKSMLLRGEVNLHHFERFALILGTIHCKSSQLATELRRVFGDTTYFEALRLEPYYLYSAQKVPTASSFLKNLAQDALMHKLALVHGDFSPKNILVHEDKMILLDYEVVHFGDPAFDVGFALTHFLSKALHVPSQRGRLVTATIRFWEVYFRAISSLEWSTSVEPRVVHHALGCLLARVAGKSTLEYLECHEMMLQKEIVLFLIKHTPSSVRDLVEEFIGRVTISAKN